jgi:rsbT co-antagonist protein RsbR
VSRSPRLRGRLIAGIRQRRAHKSNSTHANRSTILFSLLGTRRDDIAERATDWVITTAPDLQGKRPRHETKKLVERVIDVNVAIMERGDRKPLHDFVDYVTSFRASLEFRVSTILRGFLSFKQGLIQILSAERVHVRDKLAALAIVDEIYYEAIFQISDVYGAKLVEKIKTRRDEIEIELGQKRSELEYTVQMVEDLRTQLIAVSLPILRIWKGVLLVPFVGEITPERAEHARAELLEAIVAHRAKAVLMDVTGLSLVDAHAVNVLGSILRATVLLGAESIIVGIRGEVARVFVQMGEVFPGTRTFATLEDGLRQVLHLGSKTRR